MPFAVPCAPHPGPGVVARFLSLLKIRHTLPPLRHAAPSDRGALRRRGGQRILLLMSLPREVQRIRRMSELPPSWPNASPCLWPRWCNRPRLPLMPHWSPLLLLPVLAQGSLTSLGAIRTMAMIPPLPLCADLGGRRRVWGWGTVVLSSPPKTHRSRQPKRGEQVFLLCLPRALHGWE